MKELIIFENKDFGKIRSLKIENEPWFAAKDVCSILGLTNSRMAVSRLDDDEVRKLNLRRFVWRNKFCE